MFSVFLSLPVCRLQNSLQSMLAGRAPARTLPEVRANCGSVPSVALGGKSDCAPLPLAPRRISKASTWIDRPLDRSQVRIPREQPMLAAGALEGRRDWAITVEEIHEHRLGLRCVRVEVDQFGSGTKSGPHVQVAAQRNSELISRSVHRFVGQPFVKGFLRPGGQSVIGNPIR